MFIIILYYNTNLMFVLSPKYIQVKPNDKLTLFDMLYVPILKIVIYQ